MSRRHRRLAMVVALCVVTSAVLGVGGFSSAMAEQDVSIDVVADENAYLGFGGNLRCSSGTEQPLVRNRFDENTTIERIDVEITAVGGHVRIGTEGSIRQFPPGATAGLVFDGPYGPGEAAEIRVEPPNGNVSGADAVQVDLVEATGTGVDVSGASRTYAVNCPGGTGGGGGDDVDLPESE